jgi:hypothetical protein
MLRSKIATLPEEIRKELDKRLIQGGFSGYSDLTDWLNSLGLDVQISRTGVHRYGQKFENKLSALKIATDQAKAIAEASEDDAGALNDSIIRLVQTKFFNLLMELDVDDKNLPRIGQAVAKLSQSAVKQKQWQADMAEKVRKKTLDEAAEAVETAAKEQGLDEEQARFWREKVLKGR